MSENELYSLHLFIPRQRIDDECNTIFWWIKFDPHFLMEIGRSETAKPNKKDQTRPVERHRHSSHPRCMGPLIPIIIIMEIRSDHHQMRVTKSYEFYRTPIKTRSTLERSDGVSSLLQYARSQIHSSVQFGDKSASTLSDCPWPTPILF